MTGRKSRKTPHPCQPRARPRLVCRFPAAARHQGGSRPSTRTLSAGDAPNRTGPPLTDKPLSPSSGGGVTFTRTQLVATSRKTSAETRYAPAASVETRAPGRSVYSASSAGQRPPRSTVTSTRAPATAAPAGFVTRPYTVAACVGFGCAGGSAHPATSHAPATQSARRWIRPRMVPFIALLPPELLL